MRDGMMTAARFCPLSRCRSADWLSRLRICAAARCPLVDPLQCSARRCGRRPATAIRSDPWSTLKHASEIAQLAGQGVHPLNSFWPSPFVVLAPPAGTRGRRRWQVARLLPSYLPCPSQPSMLLPFLYRYFVDSLPSDLSVPH